MPAEPRRKSRITLGVLMLWVAVASVYCWNLKIAAVDQRENVEIIWREIWHSMGG